MRYAIALGIGALIDLALLLFRSAMTARLAAWQEAEKELSGLDMLFLRSAQILTAYGWILLPGVLLACVGIAALIGRDRAAAARG